MQPERGRGERAGLTRESVVSAARDLMAKDGLEALTIRAVARDLGVTPNALYTYVDSKVALLDAVLDGLLGEVEAPPSDVRDPVDGLHALMTSTYRVLLKHDRFVSAYLSRQGARGENARHLGDRMLELLARRGVTGNRGREALSVLVVYTIGSAAFTVRPPLEGDDGPRVSPDMQERHFERGLTWLLDGITS